MRFICCCCNFLSIFLFHTVTVSIVILSIEEKIVFLSCFLLFCFSITFSLYKANWFGLFISFIRLCFCFFLVYSFIWLWDSFFRLNLFFLCLFLVALQTMRLNWKKKKIIKRNNFVILFHLLLPLNEWQHGWTCLRSWTEFIIINKIYTKKPKKKK